MSMRLHDGCVSLGSPEDSELKPPPFSHLLVVDQWSRVSEPELRLESESSEIVPCAWTISSCHSLGKVYFLKHLLHWA